MTVGSSKLSTSLSWVKGLHIKRELVLGVETEQNRGDTMANSQDETVQTGDEQANVIVKDQSTGLDADSGNHHEEDNDVDDDDDDDDVEFKQERSDDTQRKSDDLEGGDRQLDDDELLVNNVVGEGSQDKIVSAEAEHASGAVQHSDKGVGETRVAKATDETAGEVERDHSQAAGYTVGQKDKVQFVDIEGDRSVVELHDGELRTSVYDAKGELKWSKNGATQLSVTGKGELNWHGWVSETADSEVVAAMRALFKRAGLPEVEPEAAGVELTGGLEDEEEEASDEESVGGLVQAEAS